MAHRSGFIVPNAGDVDPVHGSNRQAEPDAGDFSVLGTENYGILTGFNFTIDAGDFKLNTTSQINVAVLDGQIIKVDNIKAGLSGGAPDFGRFDLVVLYSDGLLSVIPGPLNLNPKFPELPDGCVLIASVWVPKLVLREDLTLANTVDKRRWILNGARGAVEGSNTFIENRSYDDPSKLGQTTFKVTGSGNVQIGTRVSLTPAYAEGDAQLRVGSHDNSDFTFQIQGDTSISKNLDVTGKVAAVQTVTGINLISAGLSDGTPPDTAGLTGSLWQDTTNGRIYFKRPPTPQRVNGYWAEIYADEYPPGTIISTLLTGSAANEYLSGSWILCDGREVEAAQYSNLAGAFPGWVLPAWTPGEDLVLGVHQLSVPDLRGKFLGGASGVEYNDEVGTIAGKNINNLTPAQLAGHRHLAGPNTAEGGGHNHGGGTTGPAGSHSHSMALSGKHIHHLTDPGHVHLGADHGMGTLGHFIQMRWGGKYMVDLYPADTGHGPVVDISDRTLSSYTGIQNTDNDGLHSHPLNTEPNHTHSLNIDPATPHYHALPQESTVGQSANIDNRPSHLVVNWYIKG